MSHLVWNYRQKIKNSECIEVVRVEAGDPETITTDRSFGKRAICLRDYVV